MAHPKKKHQKEVKADKKEDSSKKHHEAEAKGMKKEMKGKCK